MYNPSVTRLTASEALVLFVALPLVVGAAVGHRTDIGSDGVSLGMARWAIGLPLSINGCGSVLAERPREGRVFRGRAAYYSDALAGRPTASGEPYDPTKLTAAHRTWPFGTKVRVKNLNNDHTVVVRINDRGPFGRRKRILDVSRRAAEELGMIDAGVVPVSIRILSFPRRD